MTPPCYYSGTLDYNGDILPEHRRGELPERCLLCARDTRKVPPPVSPWVRRAVHGDLAPRSRGCLR